MRTEEKLRKILVSWKEFEIPNLVERDFEHQYLQTDKILTISGPRRAGKTYLCFQLISDLTNEIPDQNLIYINFEDERLHPLRGDELTKLLDIYYELFEPENKRIYFFLDEIHAMPNWELWCRRISESERNIKLVVTGSSSKLLPLELSTQLRGRSLNRSVYPFSFREFLRAKGIEYDLEKVYYGRQKPKIKREFNEYLKFGGFQEVVLEEDERIKEEILREYYSTIYQRDIIERFRIENIGAMKDFLKIRVDNFARPMTYTKSRNNLKSLGHKIGKSTLKRYFSYAKSAFFLFDLQKYSPKAKNRMRYPRKVYPIDTGLVNAVRFDFSEDRGRALENLVFLELQREGKEVFYHKNKRECDFLIKEGKKIKNAIQVTKSLESNREREIEGLIEALDEFDLERGVILTEDEKNEIEEKGFEIEVLPVWLWLLRNSE